jgi:hypothetical protein
MGHALFWCTIALTSISAGAAAADDLKGTYAFAGIQVCLSAPGGFKEDSKGNLTIPIGETNHAFTTIEGQVSYNGDGTGKVTQTFVTTVPPPNPYGAAISAGSASYAFTYAPEAKHTYRMTHTPGTFQGTLEAGPNAGQQFSIDTGSRLLRVSGDGKHVTYAITKPYVEKITFSGSPQNPVTRVCSWIGSQSQSQVD